MSSCGLEFRFYFEIGVILVIALIVYIFVFIALGVGKFLWHIQEKLNRHELSLGDRNYDPRQSRVQQTTQAPYTDYDIIRSRKATTQAPCTDCDDLRSKKADAEERLRKLSDEKGQLSSAVYDISNGLETLNSNLNTQYLTARSTGTDGEKVTEFEKAIKQVQERGRELANRAKRALPSS